MFTRECLSHRVRNSIRVDVADTALMVGQDVSVQAGYSYNWIDDAVDSGASYWIEDVDLNGNSTWHGPFGISSSSTGPITRAKSTLLSNPQAASVDRLTPSCSVNIRPGSVPIKQHMAQRFRRQMAALRLRHRRFQLHYRSNGR